MSFIPFISTKISKPYEHHQLYQMYSLNEVRQFANDNGFSIEDIAFFIYRIEPATYEALYVKDTINEVSDVFDKIQENGLPIDCFALPMEMVRRIHILELLKYTEFEDVEFYAQRYLTKEECRDINIQCKNKRKLRKAYIETLVDLINNDEFSKYDYDILIEDAHTWFRQSQHRPFAFNRNFHR